MMYFVTFRNNNTKEVHLVDDDSRASIVNAMHKQDLFVFSSYNAQDLNDVKTCYRKYISITGIDIVEAEGDIKH